jgi:hypothetical protein
MILYAFIGTWFVNQPQLEEVRKGGFLKQLIIGGWVLDPTTANLFTKNLPETHTQQVKINYVELNRAKNLIICLQCYGTTELFFATITKRPDDGSFARIPQIKINGLIYYLLISVQNMNFSI